jgi:nicotinamide-nucleotide amidase
MMFDAEVQAAARGVFDDLKEKRLRLVSAESCTGGLIAAAITDIPGSSDVLERGFVTYSNDAKAEELDVPRDTLNKYGAVSAEAARAMAEGALKHSLADVSVAVTGIAGPGGGSGGKPVGLVHFGAARKGGPTLHKEMRFGDLGRGEVRRRSVLTALALVREIAG